MGLQTCLTAGPKRARLGHPGPREGAACGRCHHSDFQRGLIKAGSMDEAKAKGWVRMQGKDYVMQDGDVVEFRFNV